MANQIATFFASQPREEQVSGVANHINQFWEPRMRSQLFAILDQEDGKGLNEMVIEAAKQIRRPAAV
nr:formate dehydrogenase subunit delta [Phyllobacterium salinisoli]